MCQAVKEVLELEGEWINCATCPCEACILVEWDRDNQITNTDCYRSDEQGKFEGPKCGNGASKVFRRSLREETEPDI
jgi:hypothetical protein